MAIRTTQIELQTRGHCDVKDVTGALRGALEKSGIQEGQATVFVAGSTAGVTIIDFDTRARRRSIIFQIVGE
jgi:thiamine phosphate synthase YjbQ (UPF0047 family)